MLMMQDRSVLCGPRRFLLESRGGAWSGLSSAPRRTTHELRRGVARAAALNCGTHSGHTVVDVPYSYRSALRAPHAMQTVLHSILPSPRGFVAPGLEGRRHG